MAAEQHMLLVCRAVLQAASMHSTFAGVVLCRLGWRNA
jgi:hypothetical protein